MSDTYEKPDWQILSEAGEHTAAVLNLRKLVKQRCSRFRRKYPDISRDAMYVIALSFLPRILKKKVRGDRELSDAWLSVIIDDILEGYCEEPDKFWEVRLPI